MYVAFIMRGPKKETGEAQILSFFCFFCFFLSVCRNEMREMQIMGNMPVPFY
jgi:hypothetical protein